MRVKNLNDTLARTYQGYSEPEPHNHTPLAPDGAAFDDSKFSRAIVKQESLKAFRRSRFTMRQATGEAMNLGDPPAKRIEQ